MRRTQVPVVTVTKNWRITMPKSVLRHLNLQPGDAVRFGVTKTNWVLVLPKRLPAKLKNELKLLIYSSGRVWRNPRA